MNKFVACFAELPDLFDHVTTRLVQVVQELSHNGACRLLLESIHSRKRPGEESAGRLHHHRFDALYIYVLFCHHHIVLSPVELLIMLGVDAQYATAYASNFLVDF